MSALTIGAWYLDVSDGAAEGRFFRVLGIEKETLDVVDLDGNRREVNRLLFETQMRPAKRVPMKGDEG